MIPMKVKDVMVRDVKACSPHDTLNRAAQLMWDHDCGVVPVIDSEDRVVGVITDRDACMGAYTKGRALSAIRVDEVMSRDVKSCRSEDAVADVEETMRKNRIRRVPVTDPLGRLSGIVSMSDLARRSAQRSKASDGFAPAEVGETLASVCRPWCELSLAPNGTRKAAVKDDAVLIPQRAS
jgi:CBS-domain-containing membrane protein